MYMNIYIYIYKRVDAIYIYIYIYIYESLVGSLFGFYDMSTIIGYLMPNPFFIQIIFSISNNSVKHEYTV